MKPPRRKKIEKGAVELAEEAAHLLRRAPGGALAAYYAGTVPFALGFLYFWADMSRSAFGFEHCAGSALVVALLFVWMKAWQAAAAAQWLSFAKGQAAPAWTLGKALRMALIQAAIQPSGLFVLPLSLAAAVPFGWTWAFYQNATVLGESASARDCAKESARLSNLEQGQNHVLISILLLFGAACFINLYVFAAQVPELRKMFFGVESVFTRSGGHWFLNTTFLSAVAAMAWLCVDPLVKAIYVLRCFYCQSLRTGAELRGLPGAGNAVARGLGIAALAAFLAGSSFAQGGGAAPADASGGAPGVSATELNRSISRVLEKRDFAWRLPREMAPEEDSEEGWLATTLDSALQTLRDWVFAMGHAIGKAFVWLRKVFSTKESHIEGRSGNGLGWATTLDAVFFVLICAIASMLGIMVARALRDRKRAGQAVAAAPAAPAPDLADENVAATQLPEEEWLKLARELAGQGNLRVALRAYYLASLAHLAHREVIAIARFKSNRDYEREARRRARSRPGLAEAFAENVAVFDRTWYGLREVTEEILDRFQKNLERMRAC